MEKETPIDDIQTFNSLKEYEVTIGIGFMSLIRRKLYFEAHSAAEIQIQLESDLELENAKIIKIKRI